MKRFISIALLLIAQSSVFAAAECIALTNYNPIAVEFDSLVSPGSSYIVEPNAKAVLSGDHMVGACVPGTNSCTVAISLTNHTGFSIIKDIPPGTHIVYGGPDNYYLDKNAHVPCK